MSLDAMAEVHTGVTVGEVDTVAARSNLDDLAQRFLGVSGEEFLRCRAAGDFGDLDRHPGFTRVKAVATLLD